MRHDDDEQEAPSIGTTQQTTAAFTSYPIDWGGNALRIQECLLRFLRGDMVLGDMVGVGLIPVKLHAFRTPPKYILP